MEAGSGIVPSLVRMEVVDFRKARFGWINEVRIKLYVDEELNSDRWYKVGSIVKLDINFKVV